MISVLSSDERLKELVAYPLPGKFNLRHYRSYHRYMFKEERNDAGRLRRIEISKPEPTLDGKSVLYASRFFLWLRISLILRRMRNRSWKEFSREELLVFFAYDMSALWKEHAFMDGNTRTTVLFCCQYLIYQQGIRINYLMLFDKRFRMRNALVMTAENVAQKKPNYTALIDILKEAM